MNASVVDMILHIPIGCLPAIHARALVCFPVTVASFPVGWPEGSDRTLLCCKLRILGAAPDSSAVALNI
jgi:hypothetical protein